MIDHKFLIKRLLLNRKTPEEIKQVPFLNRTLNQSELSSLINQIQEELSQTNELPEQESVQESHPKPAPIEYNKVVQRSRGNDKKRNILIFKVDDDLLNRLNKYLKRNSRIIKSEVIRDALEEYLEK